jgi:hypothetical protein
MMTLFVIAAHAQTAPTTQATPTTQAALSAQSAPGAQKASIRVTDQFSADGTILIPSLTVDGPAFVVVNADNGSGAAGAILGFTPISAGQHSNVRVIVDRSKMTANLHASVHTDDHQIGVFEFGKVQGADALLTLDNNQADMPFTAQALFARDQIVTNQVTVASVTVSSPSWVVIHAGDSQQIGNPIGQALVPAGTSTNVTVEVDPASVTPILWPTLHEDTGTQGQFDFGTVPNADMPLVIGDKAAVLPISTAPIIRVAADELVLGNGVISGGTASVVVGSVLSNGPGFLAVHADDNGSPGPVIGFTAVRSGLSTSVKVNIDSTKVTPNVWVMLHKDDHQIGKFEFGTVADADMPVTVNGQMVSTSVPLAPFMSLAAQPVANNQITFQQVLMDQPGFVAIHANDPTGPILAQQPVNPGLNDNVAVALDMSKITGPIFPVLHTDNSAPIQLNGKILTTQLSLSTLSNQQANACNVLMSANGSLYSKPDGSAATSGTLTQGTTLQIVGQTTAADGVIWWQTAQGQWIPSNIVSEQANCNNVPKVSG